MVRGGRRRDRIMGTNQLFITDILTILKLFQNLGVLKKVGDEKKAEWGHYWIDRRFEGKKHSLEYYFNLFFKQFNLT
jgi:hypothetical protein